MLKRAPSVYVPVEPEDNGVALPALLSIVVHGAILAFILFFHRVPTLDTVDTIETSLVTPEELADIQSNIIANRSALAAENERSSASMEDSFSDDYNDASSVATQSESRSTRLSSPRDISAPIRRSTQTPVFERSDEPADEFDMPENNGLDEEVIEERRTFDEAQAAYERQLEEEMQREMDAAADNAKSAKPTKSSKPVSETFPAAGKNSGANGGASGKSKGQIANELLNYIKPKWNPDKKFVGTKITAYITVDDNGNVLTVTTNAQDKELGDSLIAAIRQASPLTPIAGSGYTKLEPVFVVSKK